VLDRLLPDYLKAVTAISYGGTSRSSIIASTTGSRIYRCRAPQGATYPYIVVGEGQDIEVGQTADRNILRELGTYSVIIAGNPAFGFSALDQLVDDVTDCLREFRNAFIPSPSSPYKMWVQCFIVKDRIQFEGKALDGDQKPMIGYIIPIRSGYDRPVGTP